MGMVYLCEHLILQRLVAIKMVHLAADPDSPEESALVARFHREARAVAALDHPNIVRVFDVDQMATGPFMVMEYVDGTNLHALVSRRGVMTAERSAAYVRQAANGLAHAHQAGLIHRDIKPSNILLDRQGVVKLVDLGLARFDRDPARNEGITTRFDANNVIGTVDFMAPEQAFHNSPIDARSDIYSLGCTFYFLLTGRVPFPEGSLPQKMYAHQTQAPEPISQICPVLPAPLIEILERMMEKDPADRYQSAEEVVAALADWGQIPLPAVDDMPSIPASHYRLGLSRASLPALAQTPTPSPTSDVDTVMPSARRGDYARASVGGGDAGLFELNLPPLAPKPVGAPPPIGNGGAKTPPPAGRGRRVAAMLGVSGAVVALFAAAGIWQLTRSHSGGPAPAPTSHVDAPVAPFAGPILNGGGSTFVHTPMSHWASLYEQRFHVRVDYRPTGSSKGVQGMIDRVYLFGCSDAALTDEQLASARKAGGEVIHIPLVMGAVVATYNLPDVPKQLRFTGPALADIFLGKIRRWNEEPIRVLNPGIELPDMPITVVHRSDGSGTSFIWTDYLSKASAEWKSKVGANTEVTWPVGEAGRGNHGVATLVSRSTGAIGYVELTYALENNLRFGQVKNREGRFVQPSLEGVTAAAEASLTTIPDDLRYTLTDAPGEESYPLAGTAWAVLYVDQTRTGAGRNLIAFLHWVTHEGQAFVNDLRFAPLPPELVKRIDDKLASVRVATR
jgi:phosphate transport system substrate-binding protein